MTILDDRLDRIFVVLTRIDGVHYRRSFFLLGLGYVLAVLYRTADYSPAARLFPAMVAVPLVVLLVGTLLASFFGKAVEIPGPLVGVFEEIDTHQWNTDLDDATRYRREVAVLSWLAALLFLIWLLGYLLAALVYVPAFVYAYEGDVRRAIVVGVGTTVFLYVLFVEILSANIYSGVLSGLI